MMGRASTQELKAFHEEIGSRYDALTNTRSFRYFLTRRKAYLREWLGQPDHGSQRLIVDLAAGHGTYSDSISEGCEVINMDLSLNALRASQRGEDAPMRVNATALQIPLKDASVDGVLMIGLCHHVPNQLPRLFQEAVRILKAGGFLLVDEANAYNLLWFVRMRTCEIDRVGTRPLFPGQLRRAAAHAGLRIERERYWGFAPSFSDHPSIVRLFERTEALLERSALSRLCVRYSMVFRK